MTQSAFASRFVCRAAFLALGLLLCTLGPLFAQSANGTVAGIVTDSTGSAVPGAELTLQSVERPQ